MRQVSLNFSLVGKTNQFVSQFPKAERDNILNDVILDMVKEQVNFHFGDRACVVHNEAALGFAGRYPEYYAAGWFVSEDSPGHGSDLVVIAHGESMKSARNEMMEAVRVTDWEELASRY